MKRIYLLVLLSVLALPLAAASARGSGVGQHRRRRGLRRRRQQRCRLRQRLRRALQPRREPGRRRRLDAPVRVRGQHVAGSRPRSAARSRPAVATSSSSPRVERTERRCRRPTRPARRTSRPPAARSRSSTTRLRSRAARRREAARRPPASRTSSATEAPPTTRGVAPLPRGSATKAIWRVRATAARTPTTTRPTSRPRHPIRRTRRPRRAPARPRRLRAGSSGSAGVDVDIQPMLSIALDHPTLSFPGAVPGTTPSPLPEHVTVTSNDASGYTLSVHRTAFSPQDLPLGIGVGAGSLVAVPIAPASDLALASTSGPSAGGGDTVSTSVGFVSPLPARAGRALHGDADVHGDRQVRRALVALVLASGRGIHPGCRGRPRHRAQREPAAPDAPGRVRCADHRAEPGPAHAARRRVARRIRALPARAAAGAAGPRRRDLAPRCGRGGSGSRRARRLTLHVVAAPSASGRAPEITRRSCS